MLGPIDYIVVGFKGNNFNGGVLEALAEAAESGVIRVVDLLFVIKGDDGNVEMAEIADQDEELRQVAKALGHEDDMPLLTEDDIMKLGEQMQTDSSAGVIVIEQLWAKDLKRALIDVGGELIDEGRIHADAVAAAAQDIEAAN